jgi:hypothetical protein
MEVNISQITVGEKYYTQNKTVTGVVISIVSSSKPFSAKVN